MVANRSDMIVLLAIQVVLVILFAIFVTYSKDADARTPENTTPDTNLAISYPVFQDVHVMMFIGFGFLMTFLKKYSYSSVGFNMLLAAVMIQWSILVRGFYNFDPKENKIVLSIMELLESDLTTATVLISMGAVLGRTTPIQLVIMGIIEIAVGVSNEHLGIHIFKANDAGASMFVHAFGAYFGLAVSLSLRQGTYIKQAAGKTEEGAVYTSDIFAMIGTIFLWLFWPSFNGSLVEGDDQQRAIINTYLSLAACCVTAFAISALVHKETKFDRVHIQNATLAGGVAIGTASDMMIEPFGALIVGMAAGTISVLGYKFLQPFLLKYLHLHDTCGVHNLHGMPGVFAGVVGAIVAGVASETSYSHSLYLQFPALAPLANTSHFDALQSQMAGVLQPGDNRSAMAQGGYQILALGVTLVIALVSGTVTGFVLRIPGIGQVPKELWFDDKHHWEVPEEESDHQVNITENPGMGEIRMTDKVVSKLRHLVDRNVAGADV